MWHASIAVHGDDGPIPYERWGIKAREVCKREVVALLAGVGVGDLRRDRGYAVIHARRKLNDAELAMLDPDWCAIPAVDVAGDELPW